MDKELRDLLIHKGVISEYEMDIHTNEDSHHIKWAKDIVAKMHHTHANIFYSGEKYTMEEATLVYNAYKHAMSEYVKPYHVYIALNAQYHDYCGLFKDWHLDNLDEKIKESAMSFWFMDEDYEGCKVEKYFKH